ncbi:MAG TPA: M23 family metallopeptidase [Acidimicrobiia bacterium]|nr:M23 family metallopeptidase [Acidimicrobiia bacterium]
MPLDRRGLIVILLVGAIGLGPAPALAETAVGLVDATQGYWRIREADGEMTGFYYGNPGDEPFMGDWDCDGVETPGLYRRRDGYAYLRNANTEGIADVRFFFGNPGDLPVPGDFDGDGCDTLSLYRPSEHRFYIINGLGSDDLGLGAADHWFDFGAPGDLPVAGDFDGDGLDEVGVWREGALLYEDDVVPNGRAGDPDHVIAVGERDDRPVIGDWSSEGRDRPAVFRPEEAAFLLPDGSSVAWGEASWVPIAGRIEAVLEEPEPQVEPGRETPPELPLRRPADVPVTSYYGWRWHPIYQQWMMHSGWDFDAECGYPLTAPADAVVIWAGWMDDRTGNAVRLDHGGGLVTSYAHLAEVLVDVGDRVVVGEDFALVGTTGVSTGCHLHFGVRQDWEWIDPAIVLCPAIGAPSVPLDQDGCPDG